MPLSPGPRIGLWLQQTSPSDAAATLATFGATPYQCRTTLTKPLGCLK